MENDSHLEVFLANAYFFANLVFYQKFDKG